MRSPVSLLVSPVAWGLLVGAALGLGLTACAQSTPPPPVSAALDQRKNEINDYWMQIREWRVELGLPTDPSRRMNVMSRTVDQIRICRVEKDPTTAVCTDICNLKDAICDNAESICRIAGELGTDDWADKKCSSAKASCKEATRKCCQCTAGESTADPALQRAE